MRKQFLHSVIAFFCWWMLLLPFDYALFDPISKGLQAPFYWLLKSIDDSLVFESDTYGMFTLFAFALLLGIISEKLVGFILRKWNLEGKRVLQLVLSGILFFFLMKYGWDKLVKMQFYLPEPNTVYTPLGQLSKDIAFWSVTGSSYSYNLFLGISELLVALLLLFNRTRFFGSILSIVTFTQIVWINYSFDISVKGLAFTLLLASLLLSLSYLEKWKQIFGFPTTIPIESSKHTIPRIVKWIFVLLILIECCYPTFKSGNFNDDTAKRPLHHGAYEIIGNPTFKKVFIHRRGYIILQSFNDQFIDFKAVQTNNGNWRIVDTNKHLAIQLNWRKEIGEIVINSSNYKLKSLPYRSLPLLKNDVHIFSDTFH